MIVKPQADRIDQRQAADRLWAGGGDFGGEQAAEGVADERGRRKLERVEQLAVIDDEVEPTVERVRRFGIAAAGAGKFRRIDGVFLGEPRHEGAVGPKPPRAVQINQRRPAFARDLDLGLDAALPEFQPACFRRRHAHSPRVQDAAAMAGAAARFFFKRSGHQRSSYLSSH